MKPFFTCIIPFYNEGERILTVLRVVTQVAEIGEVIGVDDGSTDLAWQQVLRQYPQVKLIRLEKNQGKAAAVFQGLKEAKGKYIFLLDADLQGLQVKEMRAALKRMKAKPLIEMIILRRINDPLISKLIRGDVLVSGDRILTRKDLLEIFKTNLNGYQLEIAINNYMMKKGKIVYWLPSSARNTVKMKKFGFFEGLEEEIEMYKNLVSYVSVDDYFLQLFLFCRQNAASEQWSSQLEWFDWF